MLGQIFILGVILMIIAIVLVSVELSEKWDNLIAITMVASSFCISTSLIILLLTKIAERMG